MRSDMFWELMAMIIAFFLSLTYMCLLTGRAAEKESEHDKE